MARSTIDRRSCWRVITRTASISGHLSPSTISSSPTLPTMPTADRSTYSQPGCTPSFEETAARGLRIAGRLRPPFVWRMPLIGAATRGSGPRPCSPSRSGMQGHPRCLRLLRFRPHPPLGQPPLLRQKAALVVHLARAAHPIAKIDVGEAHAARAGDVVEDHQRAERAVARLGLVE